MKARHLVSVAGWVVLSSLSTARAAPIEVPFVYDDIPRGATYTVPVTIRNEEAVTRRITRVEVTPPSPYVRLDGRRATLPPGESVTVMLEYKARIAGPLPATIEVDFDQGPSATRALGVTIVPRRFSIETHPRREQGWVDFGRVPIGASTRRFPIQVVDRGLGPTTITCEATGDLGNGFDLLSPCPVTLSAGGVAQLEVAYTPGPSPLDVRIDTAALPVRFSDGTRVVLGLYADTYDPGFNVVSEHVSFAATTIGATRVDTVKVANFRPQPLPVVISGEGFSLVDDSPITVRFAPLRRGTHRGIAAIGEPFHPDYREVPLKGDGRDTIPFAPLVGEEDAVAEGGCAAGGGAGWLVALLVGALARRRRTV